MRMDVTPIMNKWLDGTYPNHGFIVKEVVVLETQMLMLMKEVKTD